MKFTTGLWIAGVLVVAVNVVFVVAALRTHDAIEVSYRTEAR